MTELCSEEEIRQKSCFQIRQNTIYYTNRVLLVFINDENTISQNFNTVLARFILNNFRLVFNQLETLLMRKLRSSIYVHYLRYFQKHKEPTKLNDSSLIKWRICKINTRKQRIVNHEAIFWFERFISNLTICLLFESSPIELKSSLIVYGEWGNSLF